MRVYLPLTVPQLRAALVAGEVAPGTGYAITPGLREWYIDDDEEELEYAALSAAARAGLRLLAADPAAPARRVVIVAEVAHGRDPDRAERGSIVLSSPIPLVRVAAGHLDDPASADVISAAVAAVAAADAGDGDAAFLVDEAQAQELQWYATQELAGQV